MMNRIHFIADETKLAGKKERLDVYAASFEGISRSRLKNGVSSICVNGKTAKLSSKLTGEDEVEIMWDDPVPENIMPEDIQLDVIYENPDVLVINKKQGMVVHPAAGNWSGTLVNALLFRWGMNAINNGSYRPGIVHRLDKDTSGLIICGKNRESVEKLQKQFQSRHVYKEYIAIVKGIPPVKCGEIKTQIMRDPSERKRFIAKTGTSQGKFAWTKFQCVATYGPYSLMRLCLKTGRTHQIRVHMKYINCPILGDPVYGKKDSLFDTATLMLHSRKMAITLPGEDSFRIFEAPVPRRFKKVMRVLHEQFGDKSREDFQESRSQSKSGLCFQAPAKGGVK